MSRALRLLVFVVGLMACDAPRSPRICPPDRPCPVASAEVCAEGPEARLYGRSALVAGTCAATRDEACRASAVSCPLWGQCSAPTATESTGACPEAQPDRERDHLASRNPACGAGRTCVASSDADCRAAAVCRSEGRCVARGGVCVASDAADCTASSLCADLGWCSLAPAQGNGPQRCTARRPEDCQRARACRDWGDCGVAAGGGCTGCERSEDCRVEGRCERVLTSDRCRATRPEHCRTATVCKTDGRCRALQGECVR